MKKLVFLFLSLLTAGSLFQACDNSKTYAEMLEDEKNAVNKFIKDNDIRVISLEDGYGHGIPVYTMYRLEEIRTDGSCTLYNAESREIGRAHV